MGYEEHNVKTLRKMTAARKISGRVEMNRNELIAALVSEDDKQEIIGLKRRVAELHGRVDSLETRMSRAESYTKQMGGF